MTDPRQTLLQTLSHITMRPGFDETAIRFSETAQWFLKETATLSRSWHSVLDTVTFGRGQAWRTFSRTTS